MTLGGDFLVSGEPCVAVRAEFTGGVALFGAGRCDCFLINCVLMVCCRNDDNSSYNCFTVLADCTGCIAGGRAGSGNSAYYFGIYMLTAVYGDNSACNFVSAGAIVAHCFTFAYAGGGNGVGSSVVCFIAGRNTAAGTGLVMSACRVDER